MRYQELVEHATPRVGREFQHLEDLVFIEGSSGAKFAVHILESLLKSTNDVTVKWDGNPTIYWGRNPDGDFVLVNKNAWGRTACTTPERLEEFIMSTGHGEPWRKDFAESLVNIWDKLASATPHSFRGYLYGDLLFYPNKPAVLTNESVSFTPNKVTYSVNANSPLGKKISEATIGIAVHKAFKTFGSKDGVKLYNGVSFESKSVSIISQTDVHGSVSVDQTKLESVKKAIAEHSSSIDSLLTPIKGLGDMKNIIYTYVNQTSKAKQLDTLGESFLKWLSTSSVSHPKQARILALAESNPTALPAIFALVKDIMSMKNSIIEQLDQANTDITASTLNEAGGEGYIMLDEKIKLVPRHRWVPN